MFNSGMWRLVDFRGLRTTKVCGTFFIVSPATQDGPWPRSLWDTQPVSTNRSYRAKIVFLWGDFCDNWSWIFSEMKWTIAVHETTNNTVRAPHQYTTPWGIVGFLSSSALVECHLAVRMKTWALGATFETYRTKLLLLVQKLQQQIFVQLI
jgi:hypothetical protein